MSSNRRNATIIRVLLAAVLAASAAGCATTPKRNPDAPREGLLSTEQFAASVDSHQDQVLLAAHADGLSAAQARALTSLVDRWRDTGGGPIVIQAPSHGGGEAYRSAMAIQDALAGLGVRETLIKTVGYEASTTQGAPMIVGFASFEAKGPKCGQNWDAFTRSEKNKPNSNFGCAITANIAAMVANPADLAGPRPNDPSDAQRRDTVLGKYRSGAITSSAKDSSGAGAVSTAVP
jgi:pilus assembly protein CpaD